MSLSLIVASECGHPQDRPTDEEIDGCPEIIVRRCVVCDRELWWNVDRWRGITQPTPRGRTDA